MVILTKPILIPYYKIDIVTTEDVQKRFHAYVQSGNKLRQIDIQLFINPQKYSVKKIETASQIMYPF